MKHCVLVSYVCIRPRPFVSIHPVLAIDDSLLDYQLAQHDSDHLVSGPAASGVVDITKMDLLADTLFE